MFENDGAFGFLVKGKNGVATEFLHGAYEIKAGLARHHIAMKGFAAQRAGNGAIRTDEPQIEAKLLGNWQRKRVAASGDENDFDAGMVGATQGGEIFGRNLKVRVQQRPVDIGSDQTNGRGRRAIGLWHLGKNRLSHSLL